MRLVGVFGLLLLDEVKGLLLALFLVQHAVRVKFGEAVASTCCNCSSGGWVGLLLAGFGCSWRPIVEHGCEKGLRSGLQSRELLLLALDELVLSLLERSVLVETFALLDLVLVLDLAEVLFGLCRLLRYQDRRECHARLAVYPLR